MSAARAGRRVGYYVGRRHLLLRPVPRSRPTRDTVPAAEPAPVVHDDPRDGPDGSDPDARPVLPASRERERCRRSRGSCRTTGWGSTRLGAPIWKGQRARHERRERADAGPGLEPDRASSSRGTTGVASTTTSSHRASISTATGSASRACVISPWARAGLIDSPDAVVRRVPQAASRTCSCDGAARPGDPQPPGLATHGPREGLDPGEPAEGLRLHPGSDPALILDPNPWRDVTLSPIGWHRTPAVLPGPWLRSAVAGPPGFEPGLTDPESAGLPLPHGPVGFRCYQEAWPSTGNVSSPGGTSVRNDRTIRSKSARSSSQPPGGRSRRRGSRSRRRRASSPRPRSR